MSALNFDAAKLLLYAFLFGETFSAVLLRPYFLYDPLSSLFSGRELKCIDTREYMVENNLIVYLSQHYFQTEVNKGLKFLVRN